MEKTTLVKIANRSGGNVGYKIPELGVRRQFAPRETKEVTFEELEQLSFIPGGAELIKNYLVVRDPEALKALDLNVEPEYFYSEKEVKDLLLKGNLDQFLDCLDFAPNGVLEMVKDLAVSLPVNDIDKRDAILDKLGFNVTQAIAIRETKFDGDAEEGNAHPQGRRAAVLAQGGTGASRRATAPAPAKYKVVEES